MTGMRVCRAWTEEGLVWLGLVGALVRNMSFIIPLTQYGLLYYSVLIKLFY